MHTKVLARSTVEEAEALFEWNMLGFRWKLLFRKTLQCLEKEAKRNHRRAKKRGWRAWSTFSFFPAEAGWLR